MRKPVKQCIVTELLIHALATRSVSNNMIYCASDHVAPSSAMPPKNMSAIALLLTVSTHASARADDAAVHSKSHLIKDWALLDRDRSRAGARLLVHSSACCRLFNTAKGAHSGTTFLYVQAQSRWPHDS